MRSIGSGWLVAALLVACGSSADAPGDAALDDGVVINDGAPIDGEIIDGCEEGLAVGALVRTCVPFASGVQAFDVPRVDDSIGRAAPPVGTSFADVYTPAAGECSVATHDRYWLRYRDGHVYRTWHPPTEVDVETGMPCRYGHEHGDDPRRSRLYVWSGGVPFGVANRVAAAAGHHRHEDHYGHKVVVQNHYGTAIGNGPTEDPIVATGFHCYWLSKVHQGTHSGDAIGNNEHEYQNNLLCDDGAARTPIDGWNVNTGPSHHTRVSVKTLAVWGSPGQVEACDAMVPTVVPGTGRPIPAGADTKREVKCAVATSGWTYHERPTPLVSETGDPTFGTGGLDELWKPWSQVVTRDGQRIFVSSAYYGVRNPARVYNPLPVDGGFIARRDVDGDGTVDNWLPTLEVCLALRAAGQDRAACRDLPSFPASVPTTSWWRLVESPWNGTIRIIHPKGTPLYNASSRAWFCTDYTGAETDDDPVLGATIAPSCPDGQIVQYVADTQNLWDTHAEWGPTHATGHIASSTVNARQGGTIAPGYGHEWVRFIDAPGVHAPN